MALKIFTAFGMGHDSRIWNYPQIPSNSEISFYDEVDQVAKLTLFCDPNISQKNKCFTKYRQRKKKNMSETPPATARATLGYQIQINLIKSLVFYLRR